MLFDELIFFSMKFVVGMIQNELTIMVKPQTTNKSRNLSLTKIKSLKSKIISEINTIPNIKKKQIIYPGFIPAPDKIIPKSMEKSAASPLPIFFWRNLINKVIPNGIEQIRERFATLTFSNALKR